MLHTVKICLRANHTDCIKGTLPSMEKSCPCCKGALCSPTTEFSSASIQQQGHSQQKAAPDIKATTFESLGLPAEQTLISVSVKKKPSEYEVQKTGRDEGDQYQTVREACI